VAASLVPQHETERYCDRCQAGRVCPSKVTLLSHTPQEARGSGRKHREKLGTVGLREGWALGLESSPQNEAGRVFDAEAVLCSRQ
jgi:hypothetical protein